MVRFFLALSFYVVVGRWLYSEAELSAPNLVPVIDSTLEKVQIPTHDQWDWEKINRFFVNLVPTNQNQSESQSPQNDDGGKPS